MYRAAVFLTWPDLICSSVYRPGSRQGSTACQGGLETSNDRIAGEIIFLSIVAFSISSPLVISVGWVGLDTIIVLAMYLAGSYLISLYERKDVLDKKEKANREKTVLSSPKGFYVSMFFIAGITAMAVFSLIYRTKKEIANLGYDTVIP